MNQTIFLNGISKDEFKSMMREVMIELMGTDNAKTQIEKEVLSTPEAAKYLRMEIATLYEKTSSKLIPHYKKGKKLFFNRKELDEWMASGKVKTVDEMKNDAATYRILKDKKVK